MKCGVTLDFMAAKSHNRRSRTFQIFFDQAALSTTILSMSNYAPGTSAATTQQVSALPPNQTLYIKNLNAKINKRGLCPSLGNDELTLDLRLALYCLFGTYGTPQIAYRYST